MHIANAVPTPVISPPSSTRGSPCMRISKVAWAHLTTINLMMVNTVCAALWGRPKLVALNLACLGIGFLGEPDSFVGRALQMLLTSLALMEALKK